ncbi:undecaprenyl-phosphate glucose phosphotransferase [Dysgonomonas sp. PH5-45]|nr:undecaprenyl-phosphate glucose phosphotransferase [Dysgonomonas sp. PH5-45]
MLSDLILINSFFIAFHKLSGGFLLNYVELEPYKAGEVLLLINLAYFIAVNIIPNNLAKNIVFFDKVVQRSLSFSILYIVIFTVGVYLLNVTEITLLKWVGCLLLFVGVYTLFQILLRILLKLYREKGHNYKYVIIVGGGLNGMNVYYDLSSSTYGYKVLGFFDDNKSLENALPNYLGTTAQVEKFCNENQVDEIFCTLPGNQEAKILKLINFSERNMIRFYLVPEFYKYIKRKLVLNFLQATPVVGIRPEPLQSLSNRVLKRAFDIVFSICVLLTVFPLVYIICGLLIKLESPGPILFTQKRTGLHGKIFTCYKFRSMRMNKDADTLTTVKTDPRVTKIGSFIRRTSLDEIPQFINVLLGDMSVVGPRPHMVKQTEIYNKLIDKFMIRHLIKPGLTGWAQISGYRGEIKTIDQMEGRFKCDVWYIENWSFVLDIKIIFVTVFKTIAGDKNAY